MTTQHSNVSSRRSSPYSSGGVTEADIDQSTRTPVLFFLGWALFWLLVSSLFGLMTSLKLHWPQFLDGVGFLTYGRFQAVFINSFLYGWASCGVFAVGLWLMARLSQARLRHGPLLLVAGTFWNLAVLMGIFGLLIGETTGFRGLDMGAFTAPVLLLAYALVMAWGAATFYCRQYRTTYTSQWYLLAAFFWFPWIFTVAQAMLVWAPVRGTLQSVVHAWYTYNFFGLWLAPLAIGAIYYFLPKILGRPIRYHYLASIGFWCYAVIAPWCGVAVLTSGPVPAWVPTAGIVGMTMLLVPVAIIGVNFFCTLSGLYHKARASSTLVFLLVAILAFFVLHVGQALFSYRNFQEVLQFTHFNTAFWMIGMYAFFSMTIFGAIYFLLPRVTMRDWPLPNMMKVHFVCSVAGVSLIVVSLILVGWIQGAQMNNPDVAFIDVVRSSKPWLVGASFGWMVLLVGHIAFVLNVVSLALSRTASEESRKVLLSNPPEMKVQTT